MKFLVTGGGGLIGGYLADALVADGHEVVATYRKTLPRLSQGGTPRLRLIAMDLAQPWPSVEPVDIVIHAAAHTHLIPDSTAWDYVRSNIIGTLNLIRYAQAVRPRLVILLSTLSVYGQVVVNRLDEATLLNQPELYGATKYVAELAMREAATSVPSLCVRLPGVVGQGYFTPWLGQVVQAASRQEPIRLYNPTALFNNVVHLAELRRFILHVAERGLAGWERVHLAAAEPLPVRTVVDLVVSLLGSRSRILEERPSAKRVSFIISIERLRRLCGFEPATTTAIVRQYVTENLEVLKRPEGLPIEPQVSAHRLTEPNDRPEMLIESSPFLGGGAP
jgi:UDP-glucose 4-epimerase